jgi:hypothetical protein
VYDQFAIEEAIPTLVEIITHQPGLLLPSQKRNWDRTLKQTASILWGKMKNKRAWNLNIEAARMVALTSLGYYTKNKNMIDKVLDHVDMVISKMRPDGAWPYHGDGNPSVNYHNNLLGSLLRIYEQSGYTPILQALKNSQWKAAVMGRTDEFWTSPFFKTYRWNFQKGTESGPEAVVTLSENPYMRWIMDRDMNEDRDSEVNLIENMIWYESHVEAIPLPDGYTIPDRNVFGPRAWYGNFCYAGSFWSAAPKMEGRETLMGCMTVDDEDGRLNSILTNVTPKIKLFAEDQLNKDGTRANSAWAKLTKNTVSATTITRNYSVSTASHGITAVRLRAYQGNHPIGKADRYGSGYLIELLDGSLWFQISTTPTPWQLME